MIVLFCMLVTTTINLVVTYCSYLKCLEYSVFISAKMQYRGCYLE